MDENNNCLKGNEKIAEGAIRFYKNLFTYDNTNPDYSSLNILHRCITKEDNDMFCTLPTLKELQDCVFSLDLYSSPRLDGLSGYFCQKSWRNIHYILDAEIHHRTTTIVKWIKPPNMYVKFNSDGSCIQGHCGGGGLIRNLLGNLVFAYYINWNLARVTSQKWQLFFMALNDSMLLTRCIKREWDPPWKINARKLIEEHGYHISHCFREANKPAEKISNLSHCFFRKVSPIWIDGISQPLALNQCNLPILFMSPLKLYACVQLAFELIWTPPPLFWWYLVEQSYTVITPYHVKVWDAKLKVVLLPKSMIKVGFFEK
ncbi:hypothetical protein H5410_035470 [Solanum commersonii]|uniref:RNase H type-1 domain-containing protein n=1 Tax=Solanum commersonii TaxID=4109 RepID=A0A9J5Y586_SOLCO|nr:hypothetical protein H5410_035470 [Solanum commersonii]